MKSSICGLEIDKIRLANQQIKKSLMLTYENDIAFKKKMKNLLTIQTNQNRFIEIGWSGVHNSEMCKHLIHKIRIAGSVVFKIVI